MAASAPHQPTSQLVETTSTSVPWYDPEPRTRLNGSTRSFFSSYCNLSGDALIKHLLDTHSHAWKTRPYPCIGQWGYLSPKIVKSPAYSTLLRRLKEGDRFLDLGCCVGQDLRRLTADGAPSSNMYASDIESEFWELGYELFRDRETLKAVFLQADVFDPESSLAGLKGEFDVVYIGSFLHLWEWKRQAEAVKVIMGLTRPGALVVGCQLGRSKGMEVTTGWKNGGETYFMHDAETVQRLWDEAGESNCMDWELNAKSVDVKELLPEPRDSSWMGDDARSLLFEAKRTR